MKLNHRYLLVGAGTALVLAWSALPNAVDGLFPCDLSVPQTRIGCPTSTALDVATELVGTGITIPPSPNLIYRGAAISAGKLLPGTGAKNIIGLDSGIILSSGNIGSVIGPNSSSGGASTSLHGKDPAFGDADLTALSGRQTYDATSLEFDFVPDRNRIYINYIFASEEYNEFVNTAFNDVFAFYITDNTGTSRVNCATVITAGVAQPVTINTINNGKKSGGVLIDPRTNSNLFINNDPDFVTPRNTQMDGFTKVLTCQAPVTPNVTNRIKVAIADANDAIQDSVVFLQSHSFTTTPPITILKKTNTRDTDVPQDPPGPVIKVGEAVQWTYVVTNAGFDPLTVNSVSDNQVGTISSCDKGAMPLTLPPLHPQDAGLPDPNPAAIMTCTASGVASAGNYSNIGTVTGSSTLFTGAITDSNPDRYFGAAPAIQIVTRTNHTDDNVAPGPAVLAGSSVLFTYDVTNSGNVILNGVTVSDPAVASVDCSNGIGGPQKTSLLPLETMVCKATATALAGPHSSTGTATGSIQSLTTSGTLTPFSVSASDPSNYLGVDPKLTLVKKTNTSDNNAAPGISVRAGGQIRWTYEVANAGNVALKNVHVVDSLAGAVPCPLLPDPLAEAASATCTLDGTAALGQQTNSATATGTVTVVDASGALTDVLSPPASDVEFYLGANPQLSLIKKTNTLNNNASPGVTVHAGAPIRWSYEITNSGNVALTTVQVVDTPAGPVTCPPATIPLAAGATATCTLDGTALKDQQNNSAAVTGAATVVDVNGAPVDAPAPPASDVEFYFGADPKITLLKTTNGINNDAAPGVSVLAGGPILWTYQLNNIGNVALNSVQLVDIPAGPVACPVLLAPLPVDAAASCSLAGTALKDQQTNSATVSGAVSVIDVNGSSTDVTATASDVEFYFGADPKVTLVKKTNATDNKVEPYVSVLADGPIRWTYVVTNTGNVALKHVHVDDPAGAVTCTDTTLAIGAAGAPCTLPGTALTGVQHVSTARASGAVTVVNVTGASVDVSSPDAFDDDNYFGADPHVTLIKKTNGVDNTAPPYVNVLAGAPIRWTYFVTNTGNVELKAIHVEDPDGPVTCPPAAPLAKDATAAPCTLSGTALPGTHHVSNGKAVGVIAVVDLDGLPVDASSPFAFDDDHYFGAEPHLSVVKKTNDTDNNTAPGLLVRADNPIVWTYVVKNIGNVALTNVHVVDTPAGPVTCPGTTLAVDETMAACTLNGGTALKDQQSNGATAAGAVTVVDENGSPAEAPTTASDVEYYFGADPRVALVKKTNGVPSESAPGPFVLTGQPVLWTYVVSNTGNVTLTDLVVGDDRIGSICGIPTLAAGAETTCTSAPAIAIVGPYSNTGTVTAASPVGPPVSAQKTAHYFGANPKLTLVKMTDGANNDAPPGRSVLVGDPVVFSYVVTNTGNVPLTGISVVDDQEGAVCTIQTLEAGITAAACTKNATAKKGQYTNLGTASTTFQIATTNGQQIVPVADSNVDHYFGADPHLGIVKKTNGTDNDAAPGRFILAGDPVAWSYAVSNTGNVLLADITVTDDKLGFVCTIASLAAGASAPDCTRTGVAQTGQYSNSGTASALFSIATADGQPRTVPVTSSNLENYFGANPKISLVKKTQGTNNDVAPGPSILAGSQVTWTYVVSNTGNVPLANVSVGDDREGTVCTFPTIATGQTLECTKSAAAKPGPYVNTGTASGGLEIARAGGVLSTVVVSSSNVDHYFGADPRLAIVKKTVVTVCVADDGKDSHGGYDKNTYGKDGKTGYTVSTQTTKSRNYGGGHYDGDECDKNHQSHGCELPDDGGSHDDGSKDGQWTGGQRRYGGRDNDHDSHSGVLKQVESDNNTAPGPYVKVGSAIGWSYTVKNIGNVPLTNVAVTDDKEGVICTIPALAIGQTAPACREDGIAKAGQYENVGTAATRFGPVYVNQAVMPSVPVSASDVDHYFGASPAIHIIKKTNGFNNDYAPGPTIHKGTHVTWTYIVSNIGNLQLTNVKVVDDKVGAIACPSTVLNPGSTMTCTAGGTAIGGQYVNTGTATGSSAFGPATDSDKEYYWGLDTRTYHGPVCR